MDNITLRYSTQALSPDLLSTLDVMSDGKVVSADVWTTLWNTVLKRINNIDAYCVDIDQTRIDWEQAKRDLRSTVDAIKQSLVHYGTEPPTNENVLFWVRPHSKKAPSMTPDVYYDPYSLNAQSGRAVANALANYLPLDRKLEIVFDGGDSQDVLDIKYHVDNAMSNTSSNPVENKVVKAYVDALIKALNLNAHPIGSLYFSAENIDPSELFGGTWVRIKDTFILTAGDIYTVGDTGGESEVTLTVEEIPPHKHNPNDWAVVVAPGGDTGEWAAPSGKINAPYRSVKNNQDYYTSETGGGEAHNNMPPYEVYYCWKRIE